MDVELPDGTVIEDVPDGITRKDLVARLKRNGMAVPKEWESPAAPGKLGFVDDFVGGAKATLKGAVKGATAIPGMLADVPFQIANMAGADVELPSQAQAAMLDRYVGETPSHRGVENLAAAGTGAMLPVGMAQRAAGPLAEALAANPGAQLTGALGGEGARQGAEEMGAGAWGQTAASLLGGVAGTMAPQAVGDLGLGLGNKAYRAFIEPRLASGREAIKGRTYLDAAGDRAPAVAQALRDYEPTVPGSVAPAGEAAAGAGSAEFAALQDSAERVLPSEYVARGKDRDAARLAQVRSVGRDKEALKAAEALRARNAAQNYGAIENTPVAPQADDALIQAEIDAAERAKGQALQDAGRFGTMAAQQRTLGEGGGIGRPEADTGYISESAYPPVGNPPNIPERGTTIRSDDMPGSAFPVRGQPRVPPRYTENMQRVPEAKAAEADALRVYGQRRTEESWLRAMQEKLDEQSKGASKVGMEDFASRPSVQAALSDARQTAAEQGRSFPKNPGDPFSVANLQDMKESLDRGISAAKNAEVAGRRPEISSEKLTNTRDKFIAWLESKSEEWGKARTQYREDSAPINQMKVGQYLEGKLTSALDDEAPQRAAGYAQALRDASGTLKRSRTGTNRFEELTDVLTPDQVRAVESVRDDLANMAEYRRLANAGRATGNRADDAYTRSVDQTGKMHAPNLLNRTAMLINWVTKRLEANMDAKLAEEIAREMLDPKATGDAMAKALRDRKVRAPASARYSGSLSGSARGAAAGALPNIERE